MKDKLNNSLNYAPKEALTIINRYLPHPYSCLSCINCQDQEIEEVSQNGIESLKTLRREFNKLIVPIHLKKNFFNQNGDKNKAISFNVSRTIEILKTVGDDSQYPELPENCKIALTQLKNDFENNGITVSTPLLADGGRDQESYQNN